MEQSKKKPGLYTCTDKMLRNDISLLPLSLAILSVLVLVEGQA